MKLPYEEFDLSGVTTYPLRSRASKVAWRSSPRPHRKGGGLGGLARRRCRRCWPARLQGGGAAVLEARRADRAIIWGLGAHVLKTGLVAGDRRPDGARVRVGARHQRRRPHPRLRDRAGGRHVRGRGLRRSVPARSGWPKKPAPQLNQAIIDGRRPRASGSARRSAVSCRAQPPFAHISIAARRAAAGHSAHRPRRGRHRHHPHAPRRVGRGHRRGQPARLPVLHVVGGRGSSGGVFLNCGSAVVLPEVFLKAVAVARNDGPLARRA